MAQYVKATNFASKDALLTGDPNKIVKGAEIDDEFNAIQTSVNSKADTLSPTLTGTPLAPTATPGTSTTQVATTAFVTNERSATATLTNKTVNLSSNTLVATSAQIQAAVTDETGSGSLVFSASPTFTGAPLAPTAAAGTNTTQIATTAFVKTADDNSKVSPAFTGTPTAPTATAGTATTQIATTAFVNTAVTTAVDDAKVSPAFTGTPTAPTASVGTNTTQLATTAFVNAEIANDIAAPLALKAPLASPALTGTPTAPTAAYGTSTTQLATTAFVQAALEAVYPVGSIYISSTATNPATTFGFGTWTEFGAGKVLVGQDTGDASFNTLEETGGSKNSIVVSHTHSVTDPQHSHDITVSAIGTGGGTGEFVGANNLPGTTLKSGRVISSTTGITVNSTGSSGTNANLQPYVVVKMWKRTA